MYITAVKGGTPCSTFLPPGKHPLPDFLNRNVMADERILSKTTLPDPAWAISRPRLIRRVTDAGAPRVILITGQAAQGKSTLAVEIARRPGPPVAWMHLDPSDSDPVNFFHLLVHALKMSRPDLDVSPFLKNPAIALGPATGSGRIAELAGVFMDEVIARAPVRIVMDGLDGLSCNAGSPTLIHRILDSLSRPSCLVLVSRETPPLKLESLRVRQELVALNNDDLAFSTGEIFRFYSDLHDLRLAAPQLARIRKITDGWAGGMVLVWEALRHVPEDQRIDFIENGLPAAMRGERLAYFSEAVFSRLDGRTQSFLVRSAIFDTIDPKRVARCLGDRAVEDGAAILNTMARKNLFVHPLFDPETGWGYRYNQLFRDFLLDRFHNRLDRAVQQELFTRAADLAWEAGDFEGAIRFFLQAEAFEKAAAGMKKIAMGLCARGRFSDLAGWIDILPDAMVHDDTWLSFYRVVGRRISGGRKNIRAFSKALDRFTAEGDLRGELLALAYLIEAAVFIGHPVAVLNRWLEAAWAKLETVSNNPYHAFAKAVLWMHVAFGHLSIAINPQKGLSACRSAMLLANTIKDETLAVNATIIHVFGLTLTGEIAAAERALAAIHPPVASAFPEYRTLQNVVRMELALSKGDRKRAQRLLEANQEDIDRFGLLFIYPTHVDLSGLLQIHQRRFGAAGRTARHLKDVATLAANPFYHGLALRLRALKAYHQGRYARARIWGERAVDVIARSLGESIHLFRGRLIQGMAAYHLNDPAMARQALESACDFFSRVSCHLSLAEAELGLALVEKRMGHVDAADRHRESALAMAASKGYEAFPILSARDAVDACTPALGHLRSGVALSARRIIDRLAPEDSPPAPGSEAGRETRIQRPAAAVDSHCTRPRIEIRTLGRFEVRRTGGEIISDAQWAGLRQKMLLKAILVNGCREIPKDILMDALWPDSSYDAALKRFKVTLHRLRRTLEPDMDQRTGSSCISLKDNIVSLDPVRCRVDVIDFLAACDEIRRLNRDDDRRLWACRRAVEIYGGDFLHEELYLRRAEMKRAALKERYLSVRMEMGGFFEQKGNLDEAARQYGAVIQADPLAEQAHQQLMRLLQRQGRHSAALKVYRDLAKTLVRELDTAPDPVTTRIYREIVTLTVP